MDRNSLNLAALPTGGYVATREGGVDRNCERPLRVQTPMGVATREGGVDRNKAHQVAFVNAFVSPPARVAWIEI